MSTPRRSSAWGSPIRRPAFGPTPRRLLRRIDLDAIRADGYGFQIEMTYQAKRAGAPIVEVPIRFVDRVEGESKMSMFIVVEAFGLVTWWGLLRAFNSLRGKTQPVEVPV